MNSFAFSRLTRAIQTLTTHYSPSVRKNAERKANEWLGILAGMKNGNLIIGSRQPTEAPTWVTLKVAHGGFATGQYLAETDIADFELDLCEQLALTHSPDNQSTSKRALLNQFFLTDKGLMLLLDWYKSGRYAIDFPEAGALLAVALLLDKAEDQALLSDPEIEINQWVDKAGVSTIQQALDIIEQIKPWLSRLRFYPRPTESAFVVSESVHVQSCADVISQLQQITIPDQIKLMRRTLSQWIPLLDRLTELWLDTLDEPLQPVRDINSGGVRVSGGWPCQRWPADWAQRRQALLTDLETARKHNLLPAKHAKSNSNFQVLLECLLDCEVDSRKLSGNQVSLLRKRLAAIVLKRGEIGSEKHTSLRQTQSAQLSIPLHKDIAPELRHRLERFPVVGGISDIKTVLEPVTLSANPHSEIPVPKSLTRKVERALEAPVTTLVQKKIIKSAESLGTLLSQITAYTESQRFDDAAMARLYYQLYTAFRARRSLLLLNYEKQVQFSELPWIPALNQFASTESDASDDSFNVLRKLALLCLTEFPQTILPNKIVREMSNLSRSANLDIPFTEELAADIFMGNFTKKWPNAGHKASINLSGTLYSRYYDLPAPDDSVYAIKKQKSVTRLANRFAQLCSNRSNEAGSSGSWVARNGTVLEQSQILTTHNLSQLTAELNLTETITELAPELFNKCIQWIFTRQSIKMDDWRSQLQTLKNCAYAWRQALFFVSFANTETQLSLVCDAQNRLNATKNNRFKTQMNMALNGLKQVIQGQSFDQSGFTPDKQGRRYLGWSAGKHWFLSASQS